MVEKDLEAAPRQAEAPLDWLIAIGVARKRATISAPSAVTGVLRAGARRVWLDEDPGLEVEASAEAQILVARARVAVDAAVLAAAIGIDRAVEADIGRGVAGDDAPRRDLLHFRRQSFELAKRLPEPSSTGS